jgi:serine phosphatase RsbU (regulator of sigma subunit)
LGLLISILFLASTLLSRWSPLRNFLAEQRIQATTALTLATLLILRFSAPSSNEFIASGIAAPFYITLMLSLAGILAGLAVGLAWRAICDDTQSRLGKILVSTFFFLPLLLSFGLAEYVPIFAVPVALRTGWARPVAETRRPRATILAIIAFAATYFWPPVEATPLAALFTPTSAGSTIFHFARAFLMAHLGILTLRFLLGLIFGPRRIGRRLLVSHTIAGIVPVVFTGLFVLILALLTIADMRATSAARLLESKHQYSQELFRQNSGRIASVQQDWSALPDADTAYELVPDELMNLSADWILDITNQIPKSIFWEWPASSSQLTEPLDPNRQSRLAIGLGLQWYSPADTTAPSTFTLLAELIPVSVHSPDSLRLRGMIASLRTSAADAYSRRGETSVVDSLPPPDAWLMRPRDSEETGLIRSANLTCHVVDFQTNVGDVLVRVHLIETLPSGCVTSLKEELGTHTWIEQGVSFNDLGANDNGGFDMTSIAASAPPGESANPYNSIRKQIPCQEWLSGANQWIRRQVPIIGAAHMTDMLPTAPSSEDPLTFFPIVILAFLCIFFVGAIAFAFISAVRMGRTIAVSVSHLRIGTEQLQQGDFDHRIRVIGQDELATLAEAFNEMAENLSIAQKTALEKERLEGELNLARRIQLRLLPSEPPQVEELLFAGISRPARQVGGDYYDFLPTSNNNMVFVMADVSGKGAPAAILMSTLRASLHTMLPKINSLSDLMLQINRFIYASTDATEFVTCFVGMVNTKSGELTYVNAGHEHPFLIQEDGQIVRLDKGGLMLGAFPSVPYESGTVQMNKGDLLFLFTDGLTEATNRDGYMFTEARLDKFLQANASQSPQEIMDATLAVVDEFVGGAEASDDITLLSIRRLQTNRDLS